MVEIDESLGGNIHDYSISKLISIDKYNVYNTYIVLLIKRKESKFKSLKRRNIYNCNLLYILIRVDFVEYNKS